MLPWSLLTTLFHLQTALYIPIPLTPPGLSSHRFFLEISLCVYQILKAGSFTCSFTDTCLSPEDTVSWLHPQCGLLYFRAEGESSCCHSLIITPPPYNSWFSGSCCSPHHPTPHRPPHPLKTLFPSSWPFPHFNSCHSL